MAKGNGRAFAPQIRVEVDVGGISATVWSTSRCGFIFFSVAFFLLLAVICEHTHLLSARAMQILGATTRPIVRHGYPAGEKGIMCYPRARGPEMEVSPLATK